MSDITIIPAMVLLGPLAAAATSVAATITDAARAVPESGRMSQLSGTWIHVLWPVVGSLAFFALEGGNSDPASPGFLAATAAATTVGVAVNLCLVLAEVVVDPAQPSNVQTQRGYAANAVALVTAPVAVASLGIVAAYGVGGIYALVLVILALLVLRHLIDQLLLLLTRERELESRNRELGTFHLGVLGLLTATLAQRDRLTARHSAAVSRWAGDLAALSDCGAETQWTIRTGGLLHDIGKFVLPDALLYYEGDLSEPQQRHLQGHAEKGAELVGRIAGLEAVADLVRHHHERYDGTGYPSGLVGERIPLGARMLAICEAYDAMTARASYRVPVAPSEAIVELRAHAGSSFDPELVERFADHLEGSDAAYRHGESASFENELGQVLADDRAAVPEAASSPSRQSHGRGPQIRPGRFYLGVTAKRR